MKAATNTPPFLAGGGELAQLTRQFDWSKTAIGPPDQWPQPLQTMVSVLLTARFPMFLWWGPNLIQFYNDAYRPSLGDPGKHPVALGQRGEDCWPEIWPVIGPLINQVLGGGEATMHENQLIPIQRNGRLEDVYWTFSYSPVPDETGQPGGVLVTCTETTQQVQSHQALLRSEERVQQLLMHSPVAFALFRGPQFIIELANERVLDYWDRTRDEVIDKPLFDALPEASGQGIEELLMRVYTTGERFVAKERAVTLKRNGQLEQTYVDFVYEPYRENDQTTSAGPITGVTVVCVEMTDQVLARRTLQDERNRLNTILNELPLGILMANTTGELIWGNRQVEQIFRHPFRESHDIEAYTNWQLFDPITNEPFVLEQMPMVRTLLHGETVTGVEMKLLRGDDTWGYASVNTVPVYNSEGQLQYGVAAFVDVTERKQNEKAVLESQARLQKAIQIETVGVLFFDDEGNFREANDAFLTMTGYTREQFDEQTLSAEDITQPEWMPRTRQALDELKMKSLAAPYEKEFKRPDGSRWWGLTAGTKLSNKENVEYIIDVTNRRQAETALREADQRKDEFLATLAHELRNPLASINNTLQTLHLTANENELVAPAVALMSRQTDQLVRLVDDLLDVSRISRGTVQLRLEQIDLQTVIQQAVEATRPLCERDGQALTVTQSATQIYLQGDTTRLVQVVSNVLNNAAKFSNEGGTVRLTVEREGSEVLLRVRDNGIGIAADQLDRIFDLFAQADASLERSQNGLGLGLTLVRQLVELHGGRVSVRSGGPGQGSEFTIALPVLPEVAKPQSIPDKAAKPKAAGRSILVIDDNRDAATTLAMLLKLKGHRTHSRNSGPDGITAAESLHPDVILLDIGMPGMNGYDTCRLIRQQPWGQPILLIALTGYGQEEDKRLSLEAGFEAHLTKPVDLKQLTALLAIDHTV